MARLATRSPANWNADVPRRSHASANELASEPCKDAPVDQATAIPAISAPPLPHLNRCAAAYREEYGGNEYAALPVNCFVFVIPLSNNVFRSCCLCR
jgi:hypothetical protein